MQQKAGLRNSMGGMEVGGPGTREGVSLKAGI